MDARAVAYWPRECRRTFGRVRNRFVGLSRARRQHARRSGATDGRVRRRVRDVRRRAAVGGDDSRADRAAGGHSEREHRRARLQHRSGVSETSKRTASVSKAGRRHRAVHDGTLRPQPRQRSPTPRGGVVVDPGSACVAAEVARHAGRAFPQRSHGRARRPVDARNAVRNCRARARPRRDTADHRPAVWS